MAWRLRLTTPTSGLQKDVRLPSLVRMTCFRTICLAFSVFLFEACAVSEQTPGDVGQKFEEGIRGNGKIVPNDKDHSQSSLSSDSPVTNSAGAPQP